MRSLGRQNFISSWFLIAVGLYVTGYKTLWLAADSAKKQPWTTDNPKCVLKTGLSP
jgi:hypothetical protein